MASDRVSPDGSRGARFGTCISWPGGNPAVCRALCRVQAGTSRTDPWLLALSGVGPIAIGISVGLVLLMPFLWGWVRFTDWGGAISERIALPMPVIGPVLRRSLAARWCDTVKIAVSAGVDLPAPSNWPAMRPDRRDPARRRGAHRASRSGHASLYGGFPRLLPASIPASIEYGANHTDLPTVLQTLAEMYQRQAELRVEAIPAIVTPLLILFIAGSIGFVLLALFLPLVHLISGIS